MSTAQELIAFREELKASGMDTDLINDMVRDASSTLIVSQGLTLKANTTSLAQALIDVCQADKTLFTCKDTVDQVVEWLRKR